MEMDGIWGPCDGIWAVLNMTFLGKGHPFLDMAFHRFTTSPPENH